MIISRSWDQYSLEEKLETKRIKEYYNYKSQFAHSDNIRSFEDKHYAHRDIKDFFWNHHLYALKNMDYDEYVYFLGKFRSFLRSNQFRIDKSVLFMLLYFFEWEDISQLPLEESVIENYYSKLNLNLVFKNTPLSVYLIETLYDKVGLDYVLENQPVDINFLHNHADEFTKNEWNIATKMQIFTPDFMIKNLHHLDWESLIEEQQLTLEVYEKAKRLGMNIDWDFVVINQRLDSNVIKKYWNEFDQTNQSLIMEHQELKIESIDFIASQVSKDKCAELLASYLSSSFAHSDFDRIIMGCISKWIYSKNSKCIHELLNKVSFKFDWVDFVCSDFCNYGFIYNEEIKNKIIEELDHWIHRLTIHYNPRTRRKAVGDKRLLESLAYCCKSDFIHIDVL